LPFKNLSADPEQEYFCEGVAEEIINALGRVDGLRVAARASAFSFKGQDRDIREVGAKLSVGALLEGSVRKAGNHLRITAQLVDAGSGYHLWSEKYDRNVGDLCCPEDIFGIQDEISLAVVDQLRVKLLGGEKSRIRARHSEDLDVYNLYVKARYFWNRRTAESVKKAIECFEQAIQRDPNHAPSYAGLADACMVLQDYGFVSPKEVLPRAKRAVLKALALDASLADAHASLANILLREWDWQGSEEEFSRAIELDRDYATAHHWYALKLAYAAQFDRAIAEMRLAHELDPLSLVIMRNMGLVLLYARRYDQAEQRLRKTLEMDATFSWAHAHLGLAHMQRGRYADALKEFEREEEIQKGSNAQLDAWRGIALAKMSRREEVRDLLASLSAQAGRSYVPPIFPAMLCFALGEMDRGFEWLHRGYDDRDSTLLEIGVDPGFDSVRGEARFATLLRKVGLGD
jgi:serine/threonine-protein kinase